jgi:hypothetical protein
MRVDAAVGGEESRSSYTTERRRHSWADQGHSVSESRCLALPLHNIKVTNKMYLSKMDVFVTDKRITICGTPLSVFAVLHQSSSIGSFRSRSRLVRPLMTIVHRDTERK